MLSGTRFSASCNSVTLPLRADGPPVIGGRRSYSACQRISPTSPLIRHQARTATGARTAAGVSPWCIILPSAAGRRPAYPSAGGYHACRRSLLALQAGFTGACVPCGPPSLLCAHLRNHLRILRLRSRSKGCKMAAISEEYQLRVSACSVCSQVHMRDHCDLRFTMGLIASESAPESTSSPVRRLHPGCFVRVSCSPRRGGHPVACARALHRSRIRRPAHWAVREVRWRAADLGALRTPCAPAQVSSGAGQKALQDGPACAACVLRVMRSQLRQHAWCRWAATPGCRGHRWQRRWLPGLRPEASMRRTSARPPPRQCS